MTTCSRRSATWSMTWLSLAHATVSRFKVALERPEVAYSTFFDVSPPRALVGHLPVNRGIG
jgi:hypothetical protein